MCSKVDYKSSLHENTTSQTFGFRTASSSATRNQLKKTHSSVSSELFSTTNFLLSKALCPFSSIQIGVGGAVVIQTGILLPLRNFIIPLSKLNLFFSPLSKEGISSQAKNPVSLGQLLQ